MAKAIQLSGPLFTKDVKKTLRQNMRAVLEGMAREGEAAVRANYPVGPTGRGRAGVRGRTRSLKGKPWALTAVISQQHVYPWPGGGSKQYRGGKTERRVGMFRRTASALRRSRAVAVADLTKGLN